MNGKQVANSGATAFNKGDVTTSDWLIECKTKFNAVKSVSIKKEWLDKNAEEAFAMNKDYNALCFDFGRNDRYYVVSEKIFQKIQKAFEEDNEDDGR